MSIAIQVVKWLCWLALAGMILSVLALYLPFLLDLCDDIGGAQVRCDAPQWRTVYEWGFTGVVVGFTLVVPVAMAALGIGFLLIELWRAMRPR